MKKTTRYNMAGGGMDCALYLFFGSLPFWVMNLGGESLHLGLIQSCFYVPYLTISIVSGWISDRVPRHLIFKSGSLMVVLCWWLIPLTDSLNQVYIMVVLIGTGIGCFWSPLQASIGDVSKEEDLERNLGNFNIAWSLGKAMGFLLCGFTIAFFMNIVEAVNRSALKMPFIFAGVIALITYLILPRLFQSGKESPIPPYNESVDAGTKKRFLVAAWLSNFLAFGINGLLANQFPRLATDRGFTEFQFNLYLFSVILCQVFGFMVLRKASWWQYRKNALLVIQGVMIVFLLLLTVLRTYYMVIMTAPFIGFGYSLAYYSSIFYSLHTGMGKGRNAGIHEAILGSGSILLPLGGGILATWYGLNSPYIYGFCVGVLIIIIQQILFTRK